MDEWMDGWMMAHGMGLTTHMASLFSVCGGCLALSEYFCLDIGNTSHGYIQEPGSLISLESLLRIVITVLIIDGGLLVVPVSNNRPTLT
jgi:hypothetical protein